jgi:hypothetical protein
MLKFFSGIGVLAIVAVATLTVAQPPERRDGGERRGRNPQNIVAASVAKMMAFDADEDGKLSKTEVSDPRLASLFERADADKDEVVTKDELTALFKHEASTLPPRRGGPGGFGGPPAGFGGPSEGGGPGEPGGPNGFGPPGGGPGGPPRPGEVLPRFLQDELQLTRRQRAQLEKLQADVDARLSRILTEEQSERLEELRDRGPRGPGGQGRPGIPSRPGGPPPDDRDDDGPPLGDR